MRFLKYLFGLALSVAVVSPVVAYDWSEVVRVTVLEVSYLPDRVVFKVDADAGTCAAGAWLYWYPRGTTEGEKVANSQAVLAGLMSAQARNAQIRIHGVNNGCVVQYLHVL